MNATASLESMGLVLSLTPDGKLAVDGLKRLSRERRDYAVSLAKEHKPAIIEELARRSDTNPWVAHWHSVCPGYWRDCASCPDADLYHYAADGTPVALNSQFCRRHPPPPWAQVTTQGRLLQ